MTWKRCIIALAVVAGAGLLPATAGAVEAPVVETDEVTFTILAENCDEMVEGTAVEGSGTRTSVTTERAGRHGSTLVHNVTVAAGTATDQAGNTYHWYYENRFAVANTAHAPSSFSGLMFDQFWLVGKVP